jgi:hypothetical protein
MAPTSHSIDYDSHCPLTDDVRRRIRLNSKEESYGMKQMVPFVGPALQEATGDRFSRHVTPQEVTDLDLELEKANVLMNGTSGKGGGLIDTWKSLSSQQDKQRSATTSNLLAVVEENSKILTEYQLLPVQQRQVLLGIYSAFMGAVVAAMVLFYK